MKRILTVAATISLAVAGFVSISSPQSASAVSPTSNLYALNVANQGTTSGSGQYVELGGKTYFVSSTLAKATSIWSLDGNITHTPELVFDPFVGSTAGRIAGLKGYDKYLFFWLYDTQADRNSRFWKPWVINLQTKVAKELLYEDGSSPMQQGWGAGTFTETDGVVYVMIEQGYESVAKYVTFNSADLTISDLTISPRPVNLGGNGDGWGGSPGIYVVGNYLYAFTTSTNYNRDDAQLIRFDLTTKEWSGPIENNGAEFRHIRASGKYEYNGETGFILSQATNISTQAWNQTLNDFEAYFVKPNGTFLRLGTWVSSGREAAPVNLNGELYVSENYGQQVYKIDRNTGAKSDVMSIMFPGLTTLSYLNNMKEVGDKLVFARNLNVQDQNSGARLYSWDGVNAAFDFTDVNPPVGQRSYFDAHINSRSANTYDIGAMGNYAIVQLHRDEKIGFEPYYVAPNGTVTIVKDMNVGTDGSDPDTGCFISTPEGDWMTGNLPVQNSTGYGKDVIVSMKPVGSFLQYSIIDPGEIANPCGFTFIGKDVFFQGEDPVTYQMGIYKISPTGVITKMTAVDNNPNGYSAVSYGGNYYWLEDESYGSNLWKYEVATNTVIQLTGKNDDILGYEDIEYMKLFNNQLYIVGRGSDTREDDIYVADLDSETFSVTNLTRETSRQYPNSDNWNLDNLTIFRNKIIFSTPTVERDDPDVYEIDPDTFELTKLFDVNSNPEQGYVNSLVVDGNKLYINYEDDENGDNHLRKWTSGPEASEMLLPEDFRFTCVAPVGTNLVVQNAKGEAYYYGNGLNMKKIDYDFSGDNYAFCDASFTEHGSYLSLPEYPYDNNGIGFGEEPGYIGPLTPIAVSRLGQTVNEGPSIPMSSAEPSEVTPAAPGAAGTPVATAQAGKISLTWTAPTTGGPVATYVVESTPAGAACEITGTSAVCIGLEAGVQYSFKVITTNAGGIATSSTSNKISPLPGGGAPGVPGTPVATGKDGGATVTWDAPSTGGAVDSYILQSTPAGANCVITGTTADCTGLNNGDQYKFTVIAVNDMDLVSSSISTEITIGDPATMVPSTPKAPLLTKGKFKITVTVTPPTSAGVATSYHVYLNGDTNYECDIIAPALSCVFENLNPYAYYSAYYAAINANGSSNTSDWSNGMSPYDDVAPGNPDAPTLKAGPGKLNVKVTPPTWGGEVLSYEVTLNPGGATCTITAPVTTCDISGLDPAVAYTASAVAINSQGSSSPSDNSNEVTPLSNIPATPKAPVLTAGTNKVTVKVIPPTAAGIATSYEVTLSPGGATCTITAPATTCDIADLDPTISYSASVVATNEFGSSANSKGSAAVAPISSMPGTPGTPTLVAGPGKVTVTVTAPTSGAEVTSYLVTLSPSGKTCVVTAPATTCEVTGLDPEVSYTASVVARNAEGSSSVSPVSESVTPLALVPGTPGTPTLVAGPGKVTVTVVAPTTGAAVTSYLVTLTGTGKTCVVTAPATTCEITGLDSKISYTGFVVARNAEGNSSASAASPSVTPLIALPGSPAAPTVVIGNGKVTVTAAPPVSGGAASTLTVTATPGGASCVITLPATSCEITGLTNKTSYTFAVVATNSSGSSTSSVSSAVAIPVDPNADVAPEEGDGDTGPKGIASGGTNKFVATNDSTFQLAWDKKTGKLISRATGIYTGYIEAKISFTKAGKVYTCTAQFGVLKVMPQKTAAQKAAAMKMKTFTGKQFCIDKMKMDAKTLAPKGGMTTSNFKKIKAITKTSAELAKEKLALAALKGFSGQVDIQVVRYRAWPTTMLNVGDHTGKGGKIPALVRNTKVTLG